MQLTKVTALTQNRPVVFFDGVCGLCNSAVDLILEHDRNGRLLFAPLQGPVAHETLPAELVREPDSIVLLENGKIHQRSDAVIRIMKNMGGIWRLGVLLNLIPSLVRDRVYNIIARNRYRWFGRRQVCRLPTAAEKDRFL